MKLKELFYMAGFRPAPRSYSFEVKSFTLTKDGRVDYAQWLHPNESRKDISQASVDELRKYISPGDVVIDIGAHTGDTTIPFALAAGPAGCVLALEPNPYVFPVLKKNSELNPEKTAIVPLMFAAVETPGDVEFEYSDAGFCNGGRHEGISKWNHGHAFTLKVRGVNLPAFLSQNYAGLAGRIRFIKVDAEGYDYHILTTLDDLIRKQKPYIKAEVYKLLDLPQRRRIFDFLRGFGYTVFRVESDMNYCGTKLTQETLMTSRHYDIFCVPEK